MTKRGSSWMRVAASVLPRITVATKTQVYVPRADRYGESDSDSDSERERERERERELRNIIIVDSCALWKRIGCF